MYPQNYRLGIPWSKEDCHEDLTVPNYSVSPLYTTDSCLMECYVKTVERMCNCDILGTNGKVYRHLLLIYSMFLLLGTLYATVIWQL